VTVSPDWWERTYQGRTVRVQRMADGARGTAYRGWYADGARFVHVAGDDGAEYRAEYARNWIEDAT